MIFRIVGKTVEQLKSRRKALIEGHASLVASSFAAQGDFE